MATYSPHPCAVAMFTYDLATAAFPRQIVVLHPPDGPDAYPAEVQHRIRRDVIDDYLNTAASLNASSVDVVSLHDDEAIWGGDDGEHILEFLRALTLPAVTTLHSVPRHPSQSRRRVVQAVAMASAAVVVLSAEAATRLERVYGVDPARIEVVPHGVPNLPLVDPDTIKPRLGLEGRRLVLSFGLMEPGKGYEAAIEAMPAVVATEPTALYVILGATRTGLLAAEGEAYRDRLAALAERLGVADHVRFENRFLGRVELARWVEAADVVVAPYLDPDRTASGTVAYAMSAGRAVVATPSAFARARLAKGRGVVAASSSPDAIAEAVLRLLGDRRLSETIGRKAYDATRAEVWSEAGIAYGRIFARVARPRVPVGAQIRRMVPATR